MVVPIAFNHEGKTVMSRLVYNFQVITDVILIIPVLLPIYEDFVLFFRKNGSQLWEEATQLSVRVPGTFQSLTSRLAGYFKPQRFLFLRNRDGMPVAQPGGSCRYGI